MDRREFNRRFGVTIGLAGLCQLGLPVSVRGQEDDPDTKGRNVVIDEGFEGTVPDFHTYRASYAADSRRAHGGKRSLRVNPARDGAAGGAYFRLDGKIRPRADHEFSAWVYAGATGCVRLYMSASGGEKRYIRGQTVGGVGGKWVRLTGTVRAEPRHAEDEDVMLAMVASAESWFDDVVLREVHLAQPPIEIYPRIVKSLQSHADHRVHSLAPGGTLALSPSAGVLAADFASTDVVAPHGNAVTIPANGLLVFAVDIPRPVTLDGAIMLEPDDDLSPGLRATVLCNDTVIGAAMVRAEPWQGTGNPLTGPAPDVRGTRPAARSDLQTWRVGIGRHYLFVAAPHFRAAGTFRRLELRASAVSLSTPLHQFALLSDTHLGEGRSVWMNTKLAGPAHAQLFRTLVSLREEGMAYALIAGDMTDGATTEQFRALGRICRDSGLPVYGCIGNHDSYHASSRPDALKLCSELFPTGRTDYVLEKAPLRHVVLDGSYWKLRDGTFADHYERSNSGGIGSKPEQVDWLRNTLAADPGTPTVFTWHYPLRCRGGISSCGYKQRDWSTGRDVLSTLGDAPNVSAVLCGHTHWNEVNSLGRKTHLINSAFCEWPNAYRVFRVYSDRLEWELRQVRNRGFEHESFVVAKKLSWMVSTAPGDLGGTVVL